MLDEIAAFCTTVEEKSFSKAAKKLKFSVAVITRRVAHLEEVLGVRLLQRTTRQLSLTEAGRIFYDSSQLIMQTWKASLHAVKDLNSQIRGTLKVGMPISISHIFVTAALPDFLKKHPELKINIVNGNHLLDLLGNNFDMVLYCGDLPNSTFHYKKIGHWRKIICASPDYLKRHGTPMTPNDLSKHNCIDHFDNFSQTWRFSVKEKSLEIPITGNATVNSSIDLMNLAMKGLRIVYLPSFTVKKALAAGQLISILDSYQPNVLNLYAVYPSQKYLSQKMKAFLDFLMELGIAD